MDGTLLPVVDVDMGVDSSCKASFFVFPVLSSQEPTQDVAWGLWGHYCPRVLAKASKGGCPPSFFIQPPPSPTLLW